MLKFRPACEVPSEANNTVWFVEWVGGRVVDPELDGHVIYRGVAVKSWLGWSFFDEKGNEQGDSWATKEDLFEFLKEQE